MAKNYRRAKAPPTAHRPIAPIPRATTASPARQPPFQLAQAAIGIPALLFALGAGMIPQSFWGAVILMTVSLPLFWWMLFRTFAPTARFARASGLLISLIVYVWVVWTI